MATESINKRLILASGHGFYERHSLFTSITWEKRAQKKKNMEHSYFAGHFLN